MFIKFQYIYNRTYLFDSLELEVVAATPVLLRVVDGKRHLYAGVRLVLRNIRQVTYSYTI